MSPNLPPVPGSLLLTLPNVTHLREDALVLRLVGDAGEVSAPVLAVGLRVEEGLGLRRVGVGDEEALGALHRGPLAVRALAVVWTLGRLLGCD